MICGKRFKMQKQKDVCLWDHLNTIVYCSSPLSKNGNVIDCIDWRLLERH